MQNTKIIICLLMSPLSFCAMEHGHAQEMSPSAERSSELKRLSARQSISKLVAANRSKDPSKQIRLIYQAKAAIKDGNLDTLNGILADNAIDFTSKKNEYTSASFALLLCAVKMRQLDMCELLLKAGANPNASSIEHPEGNTVLSQTIYEGMFPKPSYNIPAFCMLLIKYGAKVNRLCFVAAWAVNNDTIKTLLREVHGSDVFANEVQEEYKKVVNGSN